MMLRLILLGLAASLGLGPSGERCEPSSAIAETAWADSGPTAGATPTDDDRAFEAATAGTTADFALDLAATLAETRADDDDPAATIVQGISPVEVGLPEGEEVATASSSVDEVVPDRAIESVGTIEEPAEADCGPDEDRSRSERLTSAVRLTRDAVQAWAELIREPVEGSTPSQ